MDQKESIANHYEECWDMYDYWSGSNGGGYHFGFPKKLLEIFNNEKMTKNLSNLVIEKLGVRSELAQNFLDAGCGSGHVAKILAKKLGNNCSRVYGITISRTQIEKGKIENKKEKIDNKVFLSISDFEKTNFQDNFFDAVFFVDSMCYARGENKALAIKEAFRILKPNGRLVIADGFLNKKNNQLGLLGSFLSKKVYKLFAVSTWAEIKAFTASLNDSGFVDFKKEKLFFGIGFSVLHSLFSSFPGSLILFLKGKAKWAQVKFAFLVGIYAPLLGLHPCFSYCIFSARKEAD